MNISIRGDKLEITEAMKSYAKEKLEKLDKYLESPEKVDANIFVKVRNHSNKVEVTIPLKKLFYVLKRNRKIFILQLMLLLINWKDKLERIKQDLALKR